MSSVPFALKPPSLPALAVTALLLGLLLPPPLAGQIQGTNWFPIGPADISGGQTYSGVRVNVSGRATVVAVNPANPQDVWLGTAAGGVWHSTDGGKHWLPMSDSEASLAIGSLALDNCTASGCASVYAGTGENSIRRDTYYGMGLLVGGPSEVGFLWTLVGADLFKFASINNVVLDPTTSGAGKTVYLTLSSGVTASATESTITAPPPPQGYGVYRSQDGARTFARLPIPGADGFKPTDLKMDPTKPKILYAGFLGRGVFKTVDGGSTWCPLNPGIPLPPGCTAATGLPDPTATTFDHVQIAIAPSAPTTLYVILGNCPDPIGNGPVFGGGCSPPLFKSADSGQTWTQVNAAAPTSYSRYTHVLTVDPKTPSTLVYGGLELFRSTDSGATMSQMSVGNDVHPDHHDLVFADPNNLSLVYDVSDGGFAFSTDGGASWTSGNATLQITGFQSMSWSPLTARVMGGSQDNGTEIWLGTRVWEHRDDGDSASTVLDLDDVLEVFDVYVSVDPRRDDQSGICCGWPSITNGLTTTDPSALYPPLVEAPSAPHVLYFGTNRLYRTSNKGDAWTPVSPVLGGTGTFFPDINRTNVITAIAVAPSNGNRIYVGYYDGQLFATDGACTTPGCWRAASAGLPGTVVTRIAVDPGNADVAYATFSGFGGGPHLFKTTNGGGSWAPASNGLPAIPANTISVETSSILWAGTDDGVYRSADGGAGWTRHGNGLPRVPVYEIAIDAGRGRLFAGTHGRGAFVLAKPFLTNFEGWVNNDIWDIPVYGNGFVPPATGCTMSIIQRDGTVCASSGTDAMGGAISFDGSGQLVTSKATFYGGKPVAFACFNGNCIKNKPIAQCNPPSNPITSVTVVCGGQFGIDSVLGCPAQANPPSNVLGLSGVPFPGLLAAAATRAGAGRAPGQRQAANAAPLAAAASFDLIPSVQARDGARVLCSAPVSLAPGDGPVAALLKARDAVNGSTACRQAGVTAAVRGIPPDPQLGEDMLGSPPTLALTARAIVGAQLFTSVRAAPGAATGTCFDLGGLGSPLQSQIAVMKVDLATPPGGAAGGELTLLEHSALGNCAVRVKTDAGESAAQIAAAVMNVFQAPGIPGPDSCPAIQNPRDVTADGTSIVSVVASQLRVCTTDPDLGLFIAPKELPNVRHLALQYAVKTLCGRPGGGRPPAGYGGGADARLAAGTYFTAINLHNPTDKPVALRYKAAVALPGKPGPVSRFLDLALGPDEALSLDCAELRRLLGPPPSPAGGLVDGFIVIESEAEVDVVAVYTAAGAAGRVEALRTERVPPRVEQ